MINAVDRIPRKTARVVGNSVSFAEAGSGPTVVFFHGNATYSYTWRNVIPFLARGHRCIAPDLLGMGDSDLIFPSGPQSYSFADQTAQMEIFLELLGLDERVVVVGHELGAAMAIQYARQNPTRVAGLVLIEGAIRVASVGAIESDAAKLVSDLREASGERRVLIENAVIEDYLPRLTSRRLSNEEMDAYRKPHVKPGEPRRAMLSMMRQLPLQWSPGPIDSLVEESRLWCAQSPTPKLVIGGNPGFLVPPSILGTTARWARTDVASVKGRHFLTEDSPARLTSLILDWLAQIGHSR